MRKYLLGAVAGAVLMLLTLTVSEVRSQERDQVLIPEG